MHNTVVLNVVGLTRNLIGIHTPRIKRFLEAGWSTHLKEVFPALTCSSQAAMLTGLPPSRNGIVANGWYFKDLAEVGFWKQNDGLMQGEKIYESLKKAYPDFTCAKMFWWYNMYSDVNWSVTPRPHYPADGRKVFDIYTHPSEIRDPMVKDLGAFPFFNFWGPAAGIGASKWIAESAKWIHEQHKPTLNLVYLPHLDYGLQKYGPDAPELEADLRDIDEVVGNLVDYFSSEGSRIVILSEYGITSVTKYLHPNRVLRQAGLLAIRNSLDWEVLDAGASEAFAVSDHQICHIYVKNKGRIAEVAALFENLPGQRAVLTGDAIAAYDLDHERSGDVILMAEPDNWYTYYYWFDDKKAPDFARCVDIHRKPGYDPVELFLDPKQKSIQAKIAFTLLKKKLGFRYYMDVIPLMPELVKGSHGTPVDDPEAGPLFISNFAEANPGVERLPMMEVKTLIEKHILS